jgi:hypothetical protein
MVNDPEGSMATYDDTTLNEYIEARAVIDEDGYEPDEDEWTETYDLNAAAADIWDEKAAALVGRIDFNSDGGQFSASQFYEQAKRQAQFYRSKSRPKGIVLKPDRPFLLQDLLRPAHHEEVY